MKKWRRLGMLVRMDRGFQCLLPMAVCMMLTACGSLRNSVVVEPAAGARTPPPTTFPTPVRTPIAGSSYIVHKGDTLYSIAFRKGVDFRDLARLNSIPAPYTIWPGQRLVLSASTLHHASPAKAAAHAPVAGVPSAPVFETVTKAPAAASTVAADSHAGSTGTPRLQHPAAAASADIVPVAGVPASTHAAVTPVPSSVPAGASRAVSGVSWRWPVEGRLVSRFNSADAIPGIEIAGKSGDPVRAAADGVVVYSGNGLVGYGELVIIKHNDSFLSAYGHNRKRLVKEGQRVSAGQQIAEMGSTGATRDELEFQIRKNGNPVDPLSYLPPR
ncbi:MAG TPA: peptidoglycan DD-metalloendopeptidase family protein [Rhodanobacter sp.]|nr:peptidoglycan DD-metalloendopeptidase family protein [Rhodanobacter sp.]